MTQIPGQWFIRGRLKTRQLVLLVAIDEQASLRKAAAALNMTQPGATKLIHELEATLGVTLFERTRHGMQPTVSGEVMIRHARSMLRDLDHARDELAAIETGHSGKVMIGAIMTTIPSLLAHAVDEVKRGHPRLMVSIEIGTSNVLAPALLQGQLDVVLARPLEGFATDLLAYEHLCDEHLAMVARPGHPLGMAGTATLAEAVAFPWVFLPEASPMRRALDRMLYEAVGALPRDIVETSSILTTTTLLQHSERVAVPPADVAAYYCRNGLLAPVPIRLPPILGSYGIMTHKARGLPPGAKLFVDALRRLVREAAS